MLDNSASLPPLDPDMRRRDAIEKIYTFLRGQPYRLVLFGGSHEIHVDAPQFYRNAGDWTDFYFAFRKAREIAAEYPDGTSFKMILITDGILDPSPKDWRDQRIVPPADLKQVVGERTVRLLEEMGLPLYVILIGQQVDQELMQKMVVAANGSIAASEYAQDIAAFFDDDGLLLRRFIFRVEENQGLEVIEPIVNRITMPPAPKIEFSIAGSLLIALAFLVGVGVRSFPGAGDREILELRKESPLHIGVDRLRRINADVPAWSRRGLSLVETSRGAAATLTARDDSTELPAHGFDLDELDATALELVPLSLSDLRARLEYLAKEGTKEEQIYGLNLEYVSKDMEEGRAERLIMAPPTERKRLPAMDFLRAKVHLLHNEKLRKRLGGPSVACKTYGASSQEQELRPGSKVRIGKYEFRVDELKKGGRKDYRLGLSYETVPSPLFLKRIVPSGVQRILRMRRRHERIVR
jgi:hypothetical protein